MARVEERIHIHRPTGHVWKILTDWESQPAWMQDAKSVTVTSDHRTGVGVTIAVPTNIALGLTVMDEMRVTEWVEEHKIAVTHTGRFIKGSGAFEIQPTVRPAGEEGTLFTWWEEIDAPLGALGEAVATYAAGPYVSFIFRRSLRALKRVAESTAVRP
ncbi:SRPBCC family protein [Euzebya tangerina]|uniref:SRPBCC family protein n=1 Tax=Euzebya tangerina TaxID=591198 RepID=UPI0013C32EFB|nr:SRPBCC family protein [Euzebya tangerina]